MARIDRDLRNHTTPADSDMDDVMIAIKDIYGQEPAALWYWERLHELERGSDSSGETDAGKDPSSDIKIGRPGGIGQINTFTF